MDFTLTDDQAAVADAIELARVCYHACCGQGRGDVAQSRSMIDDFFLRRSFSTIAVVATEQACLSATRFANAFHTARGNGSRFNWANIARRAMIWPSHTEGL